MTLFLVALLLCSGLTGLATEAVKILLEEQEKNYYANMLAGCVAVVVAVLFDAAYIIYTGAALTPQNIVQAVALILLSWLSAMVGYDKVVQTIGQIETYGG